MRNYSLSIFLFFFSVSNAEGNLKVCSEFKNGNFSTFHNNWEIDKTGNSLFIVYQSDSSIADTLNIALLRTVNRVDTTYYACDYYYLIPDINNNKQAFNKYIFTLPGKYKIAVFNRTTKEVLTTTEFEVYFKTIEFDYFDFIDTWYYANSKIIFSKKLSENGELLNQGDVFNIKDNGNTITLYLELPNDRKFNSNRLYVKVYEEGECNKLVKTFTTEINRDWFWTNINLLLENPGIYSIEVYSEMDIFINSRRVEIK